jgi:3-hydroxy-9,10-secoandrosta-1,3,5(10)-triene-9,17-dione monooxygenase reductase component
VAVTAGAPPNIDRARFRDVLSSYPTGVVVVCAQIARGQVAMVFNSFTSVSLDPPLVALCAAKTSSRWAAIRAAPCFCVSVLAAHHEEACHRFARGGSERVVDIPTHSRAGGPALDEAVAWIDCVLEAEHDAGDHVIAVGRVLGLDASDERSALVFWRGRYAGMTPDGVLTRETRGSAHDDAGR